MATTTKQTTASFSNILMVRPLGILKQAGRPYSWEKHVSTVQPKEEHRTYSCFAAGLGPV
jgi:hypothetical protein